jgi:hypothetical protein
MSYKKFNESDIILNSLKAYPNCEFVVFDGNIYYNDRPSQSGAFANNILNVPNGHISLYEINIDKLSGSNNFIYPFITKQSSNAAFSTVTATSYSTDFVYGDVMSGSYPMSASITREYMAIAGQRNTGVNKDTGATFETSPVHPHFYALKNRLNFYGAVSEHFKVSSSYGDKSLQTINLISIPSIFYGNKIKPGSLSLKWYVTGSLVGELKDTKYNGELIETTGPNVGAVAGVALYDEGFLLLTGSWSITSNAIPLISGSASNQTPKWIFFGAGANDGVSVSSTAADYISASFNLNFEGTNEIQSLTMFAHARKGEVNLSNNPTFYTHGQDLIEVSSSQVYQENESRTIKNTVSSSFSDYEAPFERQVYISKVAVYDENKNLIGVATLANPVRKREDQDLTFKLKLDI